MSRFSDTLLDENSVPVPGADVYVYDSQTGALASLEDDDGNDLANPVRTDEDGNYSFNATPAIYTLDYWYGGRLRRRRSAVAVGGGGSVPDDVAAVLEPTLVEMDATLAATEDARDEAQSHRIAAQGYRDEAEDFANSASSSVAEAEAAATLAALAAQTAPNVYPDTATGLAAVADAETFWVEDAEGIALYRDNAGVAEFVDRFWSARTLEQDNEVNYYNSAADTADTRLSTTTGGTSAQAGEKTTAYIPVPNNTVFATPTGAGVRHALYSTPDVGGFISGALGQRVIPTGAANYIRLSATNAIMSTLRLEEGLSVGASGPPYVARVKIPDLQVETSQVKGLIDPDTGELGETIPVGEDNLPLTRITTNLFDPSRHVDGYALLSGGETVASGTSSIVEVEVEGGQQYSFGKKVGLVVSATSPQLYEWDNNGSYVGGATAATYTPAGNGTLQFEVLTADLNSIMVVEGAEFPRLYRPYARYHLPEHILPERLPWENLKSWSLTDSIGVPQTAYPYHINTELGLANYPADDAISAATAATGGSWTNQSTRPGVGGSALEKRVNYGTEAGNNHSISHFYNRVQYLDDSRDVVIVGGGTNGWGTPLGGGMASSDAIWIGDLEEQLALYRAAIVGGTDPELTLEGRCTAGAVLLLIHKLETMLPDRPIFFIGPFQRMSMYETANKIGWTQADTLAGNGVDLPTYAEELGRILRRLGIPYYNPFERSLLRPFIPANYAVNYKDVTHPSDVAGQELIGRDIVKWLRSFGME